MLNTRRTLRQYSLSLRWLAPVTVIAVFSTGSLAAPAVSGISGPIVDGGQVTITGSGFGAGGGSPLTWDNFENGTTGSIINSTPQIGRWSVDTYGKPRYSTTRAYSGTKSCFAAYTPANQWSNMLVDDLPHSDRFYQSFRFWWTSTGTQGQLKLMQLHGPEPTIADYAPGVMLGSSTIGWWFAYISLENSAGAEERNLPGGAPRAGQWHRFDMELKRSSAGGVADGRVVIKIDGSIVFNQTNAVTRNSSANNWELIQFFHGVTNMDGNTDVFIDDVYLDDSWARVVVSNSATFAGATIQEIQPASTWADGSAVVTLNKGAFADLSDLYLYVIDSNGIANATGWKLDAGPAPSPPTGVTVN